MGFACRESDVRGELRKSTMLFTRVECGRWGKLYYNLRHLEAHPLETVGRNKPAQFRQSLATMFSLPELHRLVPA
jgi:hypothetical protein